MDQGSWVIYMYIVAIENKPGVVKIVNQEFNFAVNERNSRDK